jgi:hypothetical protein
VTEIPRFDSQRWDSWKGCSDHQIRQSLLKQADLIHSVGPWLAFPDQPPLFDGLNAGYGLGYNASPLFGVLQHAATWTGDRQDPEWLRLSEAYRLLLQRKPEIPEPADWLAAPPVLISNYIAANVLDQFQQRNQQQLVRLLGEIEAQTDRGQLRCSISTGQCLRLEFPGLATDSFSALLNRGLLTGRLPDNAVQIRIPSMLTEFDINWLTWQLVSVAESQAATDRSTSAPIATPRPARELFPYQQEYSYRQYRFHSQLLRYKQSIALGRNPGVETTAEFVRQSLPPNLVQGQVRFVHGRNWLPFRQQVQQIQQAVYEPARQTAIKKFDALLADPAGFGIVVSVHDEIAGMGFCGPLHLFPDERGTLDDPFRGSPGTMYVLDMTVAEPYRGNLGTLIKQAILLQSVASGYGAIHGRNRDQLAGAMWAINLGLGSYQLRHLPDDYPDQEKHRDCIYYRCPLGWPPSWRQHSARFTADFLESDEDEQWVTLSRIVHQGD